MTEQNDHFDEVLKLVSETLQTRGDGSPFDKAMSAALVQIIRDVHAVPAQLEHIARAGYAITAQRERFEMIAATIMASLIVSSPNHPRADMEKLAAAACLAADELLKASRRHVL